MLFWQILGFSWALNGTFVNPYAAAVVTDEFNIWNSVDKDVNKNMRLHLNDRYFLSPEDLL